MNTGKLVGLAIIIVVITPILVGYVWPSGTEDVDTWETDKAIDITGDLSNRDIVIYDTYTGPLNNLTVWNESQDALIFPSPRSETSVENSYPVSAIESTTQAQSLTVSDMLGTGRARYGIGSGTGFTVTGETGTYAYADFWPATNVMVLYDSDSVPVKTFTPELSDIVTGDLTVLTFDEPRAYVDLSGGLGGSAQYWLWLNGLDNRSVTFWINLTHTGFSNTVYIDGLTLTWNDGLTVSDGTTTEPFGKVYSFVQITLTKDTATVTGLIGVDGFTDSTYSEGNSVEFARSGSLSTVYMKGTYMGWWVKSTVSGIGSTTGIRSSSFTPEDYTGIHSWQFQIINPSTFGSSITLAYGGTETVWNVSEGRTISITNLVTGETEEEPVRGLRVLSLVIDGTQKIYFNGIEAVSITPQDVAVTLDDEWYTSVVLSKVEQGTSTNYIWNVGSFGLDQTSFCFIGLLSCVAVAIAGSLWGRTSGESTFALHITMILCGVAYLVML